MSTRATVVTANIGRGTPPAETKANIVRVRHGFEPRVGPPPGSDLRYLPVVGWQEIDEADRGDEHDMLAATFGEDHYRNVGFAHACPISIPDPWEVVEAQVTLACHWLAKATPDRWIVEAICQHPDLKEPVRVANGHYPLARLGGREGKDRWQDCHRAWVDRAREWHRSGITTVTTRDTNRLRRMPKLHPTERQLLPNAISRISVVEGSVAVRRVGTRDVNLTIDGHSARGVDLLLSVKKG